MCFRLSRIVVLSLSLILAGQAHAQGGAPNKAQVKRLTNQLLKSYENSIAIRARLLKALGIKAPLLKREPVADNRIDNFDYALVDLCFKYQSAATLPIVPSVDYGVSSAKLNHALSGLCAFANVDGRAASEYPVDADDYAILDKAHNSQPSPAPLPTPSHAGEQREDTIKTAS